MSYQIELSYKKNDKFSDFLKNKIVDLNNNHSRHHAESRKEGFVHPPIWPSGFWKSTRCRTFRSII